jgi:hypothetical protein
MCYADSYKTNKANVFKAYEQYRKAENALKDSGEQVSYIFIQLYRRIC